MSMLPIFLKLEARPCLLVGAGNVALEKIGTLLNTGLKLRVVAPQAHPAVRQMALDGKIEWIERPFQVSDLDGNFLVIAATDVPEVNKAVYTGSVERTILCNSVDDIPNCDFYFGSIVNRGDLQIAISTAGKSPAVAQRLRREIDEQLPQDLGPWLDSLGALRSEVLATHPRSDARKSLLHRLAHRQICDSGSCPSRQLARAPLAEIPPAHAVSSASQTIELPARRQIQTGSTQAVGKVSLLGAGPGDPDLLTAKALRNIRNADVVLHDDLVPQAILGLASPAASIVNVGKRCGAKTITQEYINALMIEHARAGRIVIRLKSGDPLIFGRAAEEIAALTAASVPFEIVPGITAAFAAAAAIGCSLTDRHAASNVTFSTGHHAQSHNQSSLAHLEDMTRVVYMPGRDLTLLAQQWLDEGLPHDFPCAVVSRAAQPDQEVRCTTLANLGALTPTAAPSLLIAGWTLSQFLSGGCSISDDLQMTA